MKKTIFIITSVVVLGITFFYFKYIYGWMEFRKSTDTQKEFLNSTLNDKEGYTKDSSKILSELKRLLLRHEHDDFFYSKEFFEGTEINIDTIVYSPDLNKMGILILTKNPTSRQLMPSQNKEWYYDATSYLGVRLGDSISLSPLGPGFTNSNNKEELSNDIRQACFRTLVSKDTTEKYAFKYNLNDVRFWTSSVWQKIKDDKIKKKLFDEEKIKHPENIYEPPN